MAQVTLTAKEIERGVEVNAPVSVDGKQVGMTPITVEVPEGHHVLEFSDIIYHGTLRNTTATPAQGFDISKGETAAHFEGLYHRVRPATPGQPNPQQLPAGGQFPCPARDGLVFGSRDALRMHIFDMQEKGDPSHVNVPLP